MHWNYRVVIKNGTMGIHEVYYDDQGRPSSISEDPVGPVASNVEELRDMLNRLQQATKDPVLHYEDVADDGRRHLPRNRRLGEPMITIKCTTGRNIEVPGDSLEGADLTNLDLHRAELGKQSLRRAKLDGAVLRSAWLEGADLSEASLVEAALMAVDLRGAKLVDANLSKARLNAANLRDADLARANLQDADVGGANMENANLRGATLRCARLDLAKLMGAIADRTTVWPEGFDPRAAGVLLAP